MSARQVSYGNRLASGIPGRKSKSVSRQWPNGTTSSQMRRGRRAPGVPRRRGALVATTCRLTYVPDPVRATAKPSLISRS